MKERLDELSNKYIDGEITTTETEELNRLLAEDQTNGNILRTYEEVHLMLGKQHPLKPSFNFTQNLMEKIEASEHSKAKEKKFLFTVFSFLILIGLISVVIVFAFGGELNAGFTLKEFNFLPALKFNFGLPLKYFTKKFYLYSSEILALIGLAWGITALLGNIRFLKITLRSR